MDRFTYPSKKFLKKSKLAIENGKEIQVEISLDWRGEILLPQLASLINEKNSKDKSWKFILCLFGNLGFFAVYFYALSANYSINYSQSEKLLVKMNPNRG